jgi:TfoX/Sxy family transcriptional regulator of competence genes
LGGGLKAAADAETACNRPKILPIILRTLSSYKNEWLMAYNEFLAQRVRERLSLSHAIEEKKMMGGLCFMVDGKMCLGIVNEDLMARIAPEEQERALGPRGCRQMDFTGKPMKAFVFIGPEGTDHNEDLDHWVDLALAYNPLAKASPKKKKKG